MTKDGLEDLGEEFVDGAFANQPGILQRGIGLSSDQLSQRYGQFLCHFKPGCSTTCWVDATDPALLSPISQLCN